MTGKGDFYLPCSAEMCVGNVMYICLHITIIAKPVLGLFQSVRKRGVVIVTARTCDSVLILHGEDGRETCLSCLAFYSNSVLFTTVGVHL